MWRKPFYVADMSVSFSKNFIYLKLVKPEGYKYKSGQYAFINIPEISRFEWHPFSIASSPNSKYLWFMIKRAGNWTGRLIDQFYQIKESSYKDESSIITDDLNNKEFKNYLMQMHVNLNEDIIEHNKTLYPKVYVSSSISAPAEMAANRRKLIMVGAGSGIAPFLAFLDDQQIKAEGGRIKDGELAKSYREEFALCEKAHLILTSRDADQFSWMSPYLDRIMSNDRISDKIELHLYLTSTKCNTLSSFLFWRAFLLKQNLKSSLSQTKNPIVGSSIHINIGRPKFEHIINDIHHRESGDFYVYVCAPDFIINPVMKAWNKISKESEDNYLIRYEIF